MNNIAVHHLYDANPIPADQPWSGFRDDSLLRTIGIVIFVVCGIFQLIACFFEILNECFGEQVDDSVQNFPQLPQVQVRPVPPQKYVYHLDNDIIIDEGRDCLLEILGEFDLEMQKCFIAVDPGIVPFVIAKASYMYALGRRKDHQLPQFLDDVEKRLITEIRASIQKNEITENDLKEINAAFTLVEKFEKSSNPLVLKFKAAANDAMRDDFFKKCWPAAAQILQTTIPEEPADPEQDNALQAMLNQYYQNGLAKPKLAPEEQALQAQPSL